MELLESYEPRTAGDVAIEPTTSFEAAGESTHRCPPPEDYYLAPPTFHDVDRQS